MRIAAVLLFFALAIAAWAQTAKEPSDVPCISKDEKIFKPGSDGVKPPQLQQEKKSTDAPPRGNFSIELLVNSEGRICSAKPISGPDLASAERLSDFIVKHWKFKPATLEGKAVAVKFKTNFSSAH